MSLEKPGEINLRKIANYLNGSSSPTDALELERLSQLLRNHTKAGNAFLAMAVYSTMRRIATLMDSLETVEKKLYSPDTISSLEPKDLFMIQQQINNSLNQAFTFIQNVCGNKNQNNAASVTNILINMTDTLKSNNVVKEDAILDKTQRNNIRSLAAKLLETVKS